jgi:hypothetical protein
MHPYIADLYLMTLREERKRQAEHERLLASANRGRRKRVRCHPDRCDRRYAQTVAWVLQHIARRSAYSRSA